MSNRIASDNPETSLQNQLLNAIAGGAERESMRFMAFCADRLVLYCNKPMLVECEILISIRSVDGLENCS